MQTLGLKTPLEFNEGDVGMAGGIQARSHTTIRYPVATQHDSWNIGKASVLPGRIHGRLQILLDLPSFNR